MTLSTDILATGPGWTASHVRCCAGPGDTPFEEQHDRVCMAIVVEGSFDYRSSRGSATLATGAILIGSPGDAFACGHDHSMGDRCVCFRFDPDIYETLLSQIPGASSAGLDRAALPVPSGGPSLLVQADRLLSGDVSAEEFGHMLAATVATGDAPPQPHATCSRAAAKRIRDVVHMIEADPASPARLDALAAQAGMSPYHFLRAFGRLVGVTPYQFVLAQRLRRAAGRLCESDDPIIDVALETGFGDLSEFNRRFRRLLGTTPGGFRTRYRRRRPS